MRVLILVCAGVCGFAAEPVADEAVRMRVLSAIFPAMPVETLDRRIDSTWRLDIQPPLWFPDALAHSPAYRVTGSPQDDRERCAAQDLVKLIPSTERELRFRLYPWPGASRGELLAVLQYRFINAKPSTACPTLAGLYRMVPDGKKWKVADYFPLASARHNHLEGVCFLRLTGEAEDELVVESDSGDKARFGSDLHVLLLGHGRFQELLNVPSRLHINVQGDQWTQTLDVERTLQQHGERFCFEKTVWAAGHRRFSVPEITKPCFARGTGVGPPL
jgi:hypothetical protein